MNTWRQGYGERRRIYRRGGRWVTYKSDHPLEERIVVLTDDYRDLDGNFIPPERLAWDGVKTSPGFIEGEPCS